jgi:hypothetical protein
MRVRRRARSDIAPSCVLDRSGRSVPRMRAPAHTQCNRPGSVGARPVPDACQATKRTCQIRARSPALRQARASQRRRASNAGAGRLARPFCRACGGRRWLARGPNRRDLRARREEAVRAEQLRLVVEGPLTAASAEAAATSTTASPPVSDSSNRGPTLPRCGCSAGKSRAVEIARTRKWASSRRCPSAKR